MKIKKIATVDVINEPATKTMFEILENAGFIINKDYMSRNAEVFLEREDEK